jgi:hypothetical protein
MTAIDFPNSPTNGTSFSAGGKTWTYNGSVWVLNPRTASKTAYDIAVENGFVGTEEAWLESLEGATGPAGADGPAGAEGANGAGYDFPQRVPEAGDPPLLPPTPFDPPPTPPETIDMYQYEHSTYGIVGAYKVGDLIKYFNVNSPEDYLLGRITSLDNVGEIDEGLTFVITDYKNVLPAISDYNDQVLSLIGAEGPGYSFRQAVADPGAPSDPDPLPFSYWEDLVSGESSGKVRGIAGAFKTGDYVEIRNPFYNPGAFIRGYITSIDNYGLNDFLEITVDFWDSAEAAAETSFDVTPGYVQMSIAGLPGAAGDPLVLQSLYSRPVIEIYESLQTAYFDSSTYSDYSNIRSLGTITKQEASSVISMNFTINLSGVVGYGISVGA